MAQLSNRPTEASHHLLLRRQRNQVFEMVASAGLDPSDFAWRPGLTSDSAGFLQGQPADELYHFESTYYYSFGVDEGTGVHLTEMSPGEDQLHEWQRAGDWDTQLVIFSNWLANLRAELETPDLWTVERANESIASLVPTFDNNSQFSPTELSEINVRLDQISDRLLELADDRSLDQVEHIIEHLREQAPKQGRRDWAFLAMGALSSFMVNAAFDPQRAQQIVQILIEGIRSIGSG